MASVVVAAPIARDHLGQNLVVVLDRLSQLRAVKGAAVVRLVVRLAVGVAATDPYMVGVVVILDMELILLATAVLNTVDLNLAVAILTILDIMATLDALDMAAVVITLHMVAAPDMELVATLDTAHNNHPFGLLVDTPHKQVAKQIDFCSHGNLATLRDVQRRWHILFGP